MRVSIVTDAWSPQVNGVVTTPRGHARRARAGCHSRGDRGPARHGRAPRPVLAYVGRVAVEKNLDAFLNLELPGTKLVIGDGPERPALEKRHPAAVFLGYRFGVELAQLLSSVDVLVFPSRTDTFGLVMLEAMACGTPVAAYPVTGPIDVVVPGVTGMLDEDLERAARGALAIERDACRRAAAQWSWERASAQFLSHLVRARDGVDLHAAMAS